MKHARIAWSGAIQLAIESDGQLLITQGPHQGQRVDFDEVVWLPPLVPVPQPRTVIALGLNYADHAKELAFKAPEEPLAFRARLLKGIDLVDRREGSRPCLEAAEVGHAGRIREETLIGSQLIVFDLVELGAGGELLALLHGVLGLFDKTRDEVRQPRAVDDWHALGHEAHGHRSAEEKPEKEGCAAHEVAQSAQGASGAFIVETTTVVPSLCSRAAKYLPSARN